MSIGILWDLDGTLLDTLEDLYDTVNETMAQLGLPERTMEEVRHFVGNGARRLLELSLEGQRDVEDVWNTFHSIYVKHCQQKTAPYPGIREALEILGKRYPMAIVTKKPDTAAKIVCGDYFPGIYTQGESPVCPRKPRPDMVFQAMEKIGVESCIYIGDSEVDVETAKNAGVPCVSVLWGFRTRQEMENAGGKYFCERPEQLPALIENILGERNGK